MKREQNGTKGTGNVQQLMTADAARREASRAAALLLESYVWTVTLRCRADLTPEQRLRLDTGARQLRLMGLAKANDPRVKRFFSVFEDALRLGSIGVARMRARCEFCDAWAFFKELVSNSIEPAGDKVSSTVVVTRRAAASGDGHALAA